MTHDIIIHIPHNSTCYVRGVTEHGKQFIRDVANEEAVFHPNGDLVIHVDDRDAFIEYAEEAGTSVLVIGGAST